MTNNSFSELKQRIWSHPFHWPEDGMDIHRRLMIEQQWSKAYADDGIEEYRRFCFLAATCDHPVTPSVNVDIIWHTHLLYTKDYWETFCKEVLKRPLHHGPSKGQQENGHFYQLYGQTLDAYANEFGSINEHWWPRASERFQSMALQRLVNTHNVWVVPKPQWFIETTKRLKTVFRGGHT